jgi:hypothetical protein
MDKVHKPSDPGSYTPSSEALNCTVTSVCREELNGHRLSPLVRVRCLAFITDHFEITDLGAVYVMHDYIHTYMALLQTIISVLSFLANLSVSQFMSRCNDRC